MNIGILTGGGDCPGLNAVIRAVVKRGYQFGYEFTGIRDGWKGLIEGNVTPLTRETVSGILPRGGTILGTSRTNPFKNEGDADRVLSNIERLGIGALIAIGGDDTLGVAARLHGKGIKVVGIPKTIDNDLSGTDFTFGFDTAVSIVTWALDRLHSTTEAHHRVMVVEVMGRHAGWIAVYGGIAGGADVILIPEKPFDIDDVCEMVRKRKSQGKNFSIIVAAEGAFPKEVGGIITKDKELDAFGHARLGGVGEFLAKEIEERTGNETRFVVLGHLQRGGTPSPHDRILATRYGVKAVELINEGKFGRMVALQGNTIVDVTLEEATSKTKTVDLELYRIAEVFFG
ncbi:MAG TPA: ATP-dependent 6-phosphofructokinase [Deltaproteobacteria bacterium]|nr:ATP-dependent 6-phosphofructokinase [Deltaproteobacteria bacterium]